MPMILAIIPVLAIGTAIAAIEFRRRRLRGKRFRFHIGCEEYKKSGPTKYFKVLRFRPVPAAGSMIWLSINGCYYPLHVSGVVMNKQPRSSAPAGDIFLEWTGQTDKAVLEQFAYNLLVDCWSINHDSRDALSGEAHKQKLPVPE